MKPFIVDKFGLSFQIVREAYLERQYWSAKRGEWLSANQWRLRSKFRSREAAELELRRIQMSVTPEVMKRSVSKLGS